MRPLGFLILSYLCAAAPGVFAAPATFDELAAQAAAAREAQQVPQAIALYQQALALKPTWAQGWWAVGTMAYDSEQYPAGQKAFSEFVKLEDKVALGWAFLGLCEYQTNAYAPALEHIQKGLALGTGLPPDSVQLLHFHQALLYTRFGRFDEARREFTPFVQQKFQDPMLVASMGLDALQQPLLPEEVPVDQRPLVEAAGQTAYALIAGDSEKAEAGIHALQSGFPNAPGVHSFVANYLLATQPDLNMHPEPVIAELRRELDLNPKNARAEALISLLLVQAGQEAEAAPFAKKAALDGPTAPLAQYACGMAWARSDNNHEAIEHLEAAERLDPVNLTYHIALAGVYGKAGRYEDSRRERQLSIQIARENN